MAIDIHALTDVFDIGSIDNKDVWEDLLDILKNEKDNDNLGHYFFRNGDFDTNSLVDKIQSKIDLTEPDAFNNLVEYLNENPSKNFWNESVGTAIRYLSKHINADRNTIIPGTGDNITYGDLIDADAAATFNYTNHFIVPWKNMDGSDYKTVRAGDEIKSVIEDDSNLQFTHKGVKNWIRLIMPEYDRYVEIEDLDRNFWVIGQVVAAISAYLFDDDSPVRKMFSDLLKEITELWENILYLWAAMALYDNKKYTDVHVEVCYVPNDEQYTQYKYDNFAKTGVSWNDLCNIFEYKIQEYPQSNLILIPIRRLTNYEHNYFTTERYSGIMFYDRNNPFNKNNGFRILAFKQDDIETGDFKVEDYKNKLCAAKTVSEDTLDIIYPFSEVETTPEINRNAYYAAIRTTVTNLVKGENYSYNPQTGFAFKSIEIRGYDAIRNAVTDEPLGYDDIITRKYYTSSNFIQINSAVDDSGHIVRALVDEPHNVSSFTDGEYKIKRGYYLGELASKRVLTKEISYTINEHSITMPPIVSDAENNRVYYYDILQVENDIADVNKQTLSLVKQLVYSKKPNAIELLIGTRKFDLFKDIPSTSTVKKNLLIEATGREGLGKYYAKKNGKNLLYKRSSGQDSEGNDYESYKGVPLDESTTTTTHYFSETIDANFTEDLNFNGEDNYIDNPYILPFCIYSKIHVDTLNPENYSFVTKNKSVNAYQLETGESISSIFDKLKYTGAHAARSDLGAILRIPGIGDIEYEEYENYRVSPSAILYGESGQPTIGAYALYVKGDKSATRTRHTWNNATVMRFIKDGDTQFKSDNWCIIYIQTYGIYAPVGLEPQSGNYINGADSIKAYREGATEDTQTGEITPKGNVTTEKPMAFKTKVHVFLPNGKYESYTREMWYCTNTNTRPISGNDNFTWDAGHAISKTSGFDHYADLINSNINDRSGDSTIGYYKKVVESSDYTGYEEINGVYVRKTKRDIRENPSDAPIYNFYNENYYRTGK